MGLENAIRAWRYRKIKSKPIKLLEKRKRLELKIYQERMRWERERDPPRWDGYCWWCWWAQHSVGETDRREAQHLREVKRKREENDVYAFIAFCSFFFSPLILLAGVSGYANDRAESCRKTAQWRTNPWSLLYFFLCCWVDFLFYPPPSPSSCNLLLLHQLTHIF